MSPKKFMKVGNLYKHLNRCFTGMEALCKFTEVSVLIRTFLKLFAISETHNTNGGCCLGYLSFQKHIFICGYHIYGEPICRCKHLTTSCFPVKLYPSIDILKYMLFCYFYFSYITLNIIWVFIPCVSFITLEFHFRRVTRKDKDIRWIIEKAREFWKNIYCCFIDYAKAFDCVDHNKL